MCGNEHEDPFTMSLRLCDDDGMVSEKPIDDPAPTLDESYIARLNRLRNLSLRACGERPEQVEPFHCTGHAHVAGEHIRCTSPAHLATVGAQITASHAVSYGGVPVTVIDGLKLTAIPPAAGTGFSEPFTLAAGQIVTLGQPPVGLLFPPPPGARPAAGTATASTR